MKVRIKEIMQEKGVSSVSLADGIGVSKVTVSNLINNKTMPSIETLDKIAGVLGVHISDLFDRPESEHSDGLFTCPNCGTVLEVKKKE
jgi:transcriptional regulator with XRE-family HTH domain